MIAPSLSRFPESQLRLLQIQTVAIQRPELGRIKDVEFEIMLVGLRDDLKAELPLWRCSVLDSFPEVFSVEIWILPGKFQSFIPNQRVDPKLGREGEFDERSLILAVNHSISIDAKSLHHTERSWDSAV